MKTVTVLTFFALCGCRASDGLLSIHEVKDTTVSGAEFRIVGNRLVARATTLVNLLGIAFKVPEGRIESPAWTREARWNLDGQCASPGAAECAKWLQEELTARFGMTVSLDQRTSDVWALRVVDRSRMEIATAPPPPGLVKPEGDLIRWPALYTTSKRLAQLLEQRSDRPVVDETREKPGTVWILRDFTINQKSFDPDLVNRHGLILARSKAGVTFLRVQKMRRQPTEN